MLWFSEGYSAIPGMIWTRSVEAQKSDRTAARRETAILGESLGFNQQPGQTLEDVSFFHFFECLVSHYFSHFPLHECNCHSLDFLELRVIFLNPQSVI